jgi:hypothetical protein
MLRFAVDEDFDNRIVRGLLRLLPTLDVVRVQDVGLLGKRDPEVLEWAANENRILLTHDATTMTNHAYSRVESGAPMAGLFEVSQEIAIGEAIADLLLIATCSVDGEYANQVRYLPLRPSAITKNDPFVLRKSDPHREHHLARANDCL